jgi:hypothetical protein
LNKRIAIFLLPLLIALLALCVGNWAVRAQQAEVIPAFIWPVGGGVAPDLPQSSAYGPRLQYGRDYSYDYHQGIDIPTPVNTPLLAALTGTVRIAGSHPLYADGIVQLDHGDGLYSNYIHITASLVTTGQIVGRGRPVALSGLGSNFAHLHFEIRQGSIFRKDAVNPWRYLPYADTQRHTVEITQVLASRAVWVQATAPANELDIAQISLSVRSASGVELFDQRLLDYEARNRAYNGDPALLDNPELDKILIAPERFSSASSLYVMNMLFYDLQGRGPVRVQACAIDLHGGSICIEQEGIFEHRIFTPLFRGEE